MNELGIVADIAQGGLEALEKVKKRYKRTGDSYKLILMDYSMPICSGPKATQEILKYLAKKAPNVPRPYICGVSAYTLKNHRDIALKAGMDNFVTKFLDVADIAKVLAKVNLIDKNS